MDVRRQLPETTRTAIAACRDGLFCASFQAYCVDGTHSVSRKPMSSILVGNQGRGG
jgi:hypothetical protein